MLKSQDDVFDLIIRFFQEIEANKAKPGGPPGHIAMGRHEDRHVACRMVVRGTFIAEFAARFHQGFAEADAKKGLILLKRIIAKANADAAKIFFAEI